ncbi:MAG: hypothetical protein LBR54_04415 [Oscillospiraceae bacterium]|jgi:hypothetical protein|nr:hypothetical protein [Oscillospiraceae bacterium]
MLIKRELTNTEISDIVDYTIQKIESFPKEWGYTVQNYFDILYPDEVDQYLMRREITRMGLANMAANRAKGDCYAV